MSQPKLTIGMAVYDDFDGAYFSLQALRMFHDMRSVELLVVDNKPDSAGSGDLKNLVEGNLGRETAGARYIAAPEVVGTSAPRDRVFREATGEAVLCMDSHVMLAPGAVARLLAYYAANPGTPDLLSGPLMYDSLSNLSTHYSPVWRAQMYGIWGQAWQPPVGSIVGQNFSVVQTPTDHAGLISLDMTATPLRDDWHGELAYAGHERVLIEAGHKPLGYDPTDVFEVPGQGLGVFTCNRAAWLGFNPHFRGFGGEELYIHEKFRQAGAKCLCLGFLKWLHRFARPGGVKYPLTLWDKVRNYYLGHTELGLSVEPVHSHFVKSGNIRQSEWDALAADPFSPLPPPAVIAASQLAGIYNAALTTKRDLNEHVATLRALAVGNRVTDISIRKESLIAFAAGDPAKLTAFNAEASDANAVTAAAACGVATVSRSIEPEAIEETDILFLNTRHTEAQLTAELTKFAPFVTKKIVLHNTTAFGERGEDGGDGLSLAVRKFVEADDTDWFIASHVTAQHGLTILSRELGERPERPIRIWPWGPGAELKAILKAIEVNPSPSCDCNQKARQMDAWGVEGCRTNFDTIVEWMKAGQDRWGWTDKIKMAANAVKSGLAFHLNPLDPFPSLIRHAIDTAEIKMKAETEKEKGYALAA